MCSAVLSFEAVMSLLGILILNGLSSVSVAVAAAIRCGVGRMCGGAPAGRGRRGGYAFGHAVQLALVGVGWLALPLLFMGVLFAALWIAACVIGMRIDGPPLA